ncbi:unnamed protein product [Protopolystoma xenopodis]|uniref:Major facilitator superfamily (MFS) profile domain-containing protein n=1 Tax=Protopolystoma xenopodis TaxID=117903 RepID=A0A3S5A5A8_9PLAT|nr:unnamed protein product [Protopolystoma xenopodis]
MVKGAAFGPLLAGMLVPYGWRAVFAMLILSDICAFLICLRILLTLGRSSHELPLNSFGTTMQEEHIFHS